MILAYTCDPLLARAFTPPHPRLGRYEVCTSPDPPERAEPEGFTYGPPEELDPSEALGTAGPYDRSKLAQLYRGRRVHVLRGWRTDGDRLESVTLLSPYPDAELTRLNEGTMVIRFTIERTALHHERTALHHGGRGGHGGTVVLD